MKINILISFPLGAYFHQNINNYTYKRLLNMIHKLSCINNSSKCKDCNLQSSCQYYMITGENFNGYPGLIMKNDLFMRTIFRENDECLFEFYLIGKCECLEYYVTTFFEDYLNHYLCGFYFQIKEIKFQNIENQIIESRMLNITTTIEEDEFKNLYNCMFNYYNKKYECNFLLLQNEYNISNKKSSKMDMMNCLTKKIYPKGIIGKVYVEERINNIIFNIGIGKYNFLGGGKIEN